MTVLPPAGTRTGSAPDTDTWVVIGLNTPAGFWVTIVLVTEVWTRVAAPAVGERLGLAVVTRGPLGLKLTAAMAGVAGARAPPPGSAVPGLGVVLELTGVGCRLTGLELTGVTF